MKNRPLLVLLISPLLFSISGCNKKDNKSSSSSSEESSSTTTSSEEPFDYTPIDKEIEGCYNYFVKYTTNYTEDSPAFGLCRDRLTDLTTCSIAATGFLLGSYPVFVEQGLMDKDDAKYKADKTLDTILSMQNDTSVSYAGCLSHFVNINTAKRLGTSEISTIDTAILVSGAITASQYFGGDLIEKANTIWSNVNFNRFVTTKNGKTHISMGVDDPEKRNQLSPWDYYAEQLMIYILGAGNPNHANRIDAKYYSNIAKKTGELQGIKHIYSWYGSLFTYQYSHAFFNFRNYNDANGINWYENSVNASKTNYLHCQQLSANYASFSEESWGLTACDTPLGYSGLLGCRPRGYDGNSIDYQRIQGTIAPTAAVSSMPFTPDESYRALKFFQSLEKLNHEKLGLRDSFNLDFNGGGAWYDSDFIGIDKGIEVMQLYNFKVKDFVSNLAMQNPYVIEGFINNGFVEVEDGIQR